jgi:hypothetical protein
MPLGSGIFGGLEVSAALSGRNPTTTKKRIPNLKGRSEPVSPKMDSRARSPDLLIDSNKGGKTACVFLVRR